MLPLLRSEIFRLSRRPMPRVLLVILAAGTILLYLILWMAVHAPRSVHAENVGRLKDSLLLHSVPTMGLSLIQQIATILVIILAASLVASEFSWGTIRTVLPRASGRPQFLTAKVLTLVLFSIVLVIVGFVAALAGSALVTVLDGAKLEVGSSFLPDAVGGVARAVYVLLPYAALAFLIGLWTRSVAAGIGVGLGIYFLQSLVVSLLVIAGGPLKQVVQALPSVNAQALLSSDVATTGTPGLTLPDPWQAAGVLAAYIIAFLALAYWHFRRTDITVGPTG